VSLNVGGRVFDFLRENVTMNMKTDQSTHAAFNEDEKIYEIRNRVKKTGEGMSGYEDIELCIMVLTNVTVSEEGQKHLLGNDKTKGLILDNLFGMFCYFIKSGIFDFVANIFANISAIKEGRELIITSQTKILAKIIDMIRYEKVNQHRRIHLLECLRNIAFEYEA